MKVPKQKSLAAPTVANRGNLRVKECFGKTKMLVADVEPHMRPKTTKCPNHGIQTAIHVRREPPWQVFCLMCLREANQDLEITVNITLQEQSDAEPS